MASEDTTAEVCARCDTDHRGLADGSMEARVACISAQALRVHSMAERLSSTGFNPSELVSAEHHPNQPDSPLIDVEDFPSVPGSSGEVQG